MRETVSVGDRLSEGRVGRGRSADPDLCLLDLALLFETAAKAVLVSGVWFGYGHHDSVHSFGASVVSALVVGVRQQVACDVIIIRLSEVSLKELDGRRVTALLDELSGLRHHRAIRHLVPLRMPGLLRRRVGGSPRLVRRRDRPAPSHLRPLGSTLRRHLDRLTTLDVGQTYQTSTVYNFSTVGGRH
jgi:hypothetical protein